ncbi:PREDICTED: uncharacterized protein LOC102256435 [Myotis brandtii]|uniref:uncharacterized protein LOC102256435 n=1 Tax=Myotis brandtii TaxID=109478 RepID=UPI0003BB8D45|nr:PREDICTED: uncharacterized protein LOC102256435 [Myotis brandtii]
MLSRPLALSQRVRLPSLCSRVLLRCVNVPQRFHLRTGPGAAPRSWLLPDPGCCDGSAATGGGGGPWDKPENPRPQRGTLRRGKRSRTSEVSPSFLRRRPRTSQGLFRWRDTPQACDSGRCICFALGSDFISWTPSSPSRDVITVLTSQTGFISVCKAEDQLENRDHKNRLKTRTARKISTFLAWLQTQRVTQNHTNPHCAGTGAERALSAPRGRVAVWKDAVSRHFSMNCSERMANQESAEMQQHGWNWRALC